MTFSDALLFSVVGLIALNHVLARLPRWYAWAWAFWPVQVINLLVAIYLMKEGIPDLVGQLAIFNWILGLLFIFRIVVNNNRLVRHRREAADADRDAEDRKKERIRAALAASAEE